MDKEKIEQYIKIAKLYYESQYSQDKIAKQLDISRPDFRPKKVYKILILSHL